MEMILPFGYRCKGAECEAEWMPVSVCGEKTYQSWELSRGCKMTGAYCCLIYTACIKKKKIAGETH